MLKSIIEFESQYWLRKPTTWIYFAAFFILSFLAFVGTGGLFDGPHEVSNSTMKWINSPSEILNFTQYFNKLFLFLLPTVIGASLYKDFNTNTYRLLYSYPLDKRDYLIGKFFSSFLITILIASGVYLGLIIGELIPGLHPQKTGPFNTWGYLSSFFILTIPNLLVFGIFTFAAVVRTRNIYAGFVAIIILVCVQLISENISTNKSFIALSDPFGQNTIGYLTQYWNVEDQNTNAIPIVGYLLINRLIWFAIATLIWIITYRFFRFHQHISSFGKLSKNTKKSNLTENQSADTQPLSTAGFNYSLRANFNSCLIQSRSHLTYILTNKIFWFLSVSGLFAVVFILARVTNNSEMTTLPVTSIMLAVPANFFTTIIMLITFIYSGMLVHRDKRYQMNYLSAITPIPTWTFILSRFIAVTVVQLILLGIMLVAGVALQLFNHHYDLQLQLYLTHLYGLTLQYLVIWSLASFFIHTVIPNVYLGIFILLMGWVGVGALPQVGVDSRIILFNPTPYLQYSDLNGYGFELKPYLYIQLYWAIFGVLLMVLTSLLWNRMLTASLREKWQLVKQRANRFTLLTLFILLASFGFIGIDVLQKESDPLIKSDSKVSSLFKDFKSKYSQYKNLPQPTIISSYLELDIYPVELGFEASGFYTVVNKTSNPIDTLVIRTGFDEQTTFSLGKPVTRIIDDRETKFHIQELQESLMPGDSLRMNFKIKSTPNAFFVKNSNVLSNGTFIGSDIMPRFGYKDSGDSEAHPSDSVAAQHNILGPDADLVQFETIISTTSSQKAVAAGYLIDSWQKGARSFYHYKMDQPVKFAMGFNSGDFEHHKESFDGVSLEVFYQPNHSYNVTNMVDGLKSALKYNSRYFSPYQHREARIIEFPISEGTYATTFANSIPTSERRFISNNRPDASEVDLAFYVAAHELTHQWWGNQVIPANVKGSRMLSESTTEYITLKLYEQQFGKAKALGFLKLQRERYFKGRRRNEGDEPPLYLVSPTQSHISYGKGAIVYHAVSEHIGEVAFNQILKDFLIEYQYKTSPYPTSIDFTKHLKVRVPDSIQYLIHDLFESVTFHDLQVEEVEFEQAENDSFKLKAIIQFEKETDGTEKRFEDEYVQIGAYDSRNQLIDIITVKLSSGKNIVNLNFESEPKKLVFDPKLLLLEKDVTNNEWEL